MQKVWGRSEMEEKALLCSVAEVTLSKLGEELLGPKAEEVLEVPGRWMAVASALASNQEPFAGRTAAH